MKVEALKRDRINDFVEYCRKHRKEIDDSFLYDENLKNFEPNNENPTYIVIDDKAQIIATASLIIDDYNRRGKKGRFRIFHSEHEDIECYKVLMEAILNHRTGLHKVIIFVLEVNETLIRFIEELGFSVERYSYLLVRDVIEVPEFSLPEGYEIKSLVSGKDERIWCEVRNAGFANLQGNETPLTPEMVKKMISDEDNIEDGSMILYHRGKPIGIVRCTNEEYYNSPIMNIGPLAIIPEYQDRGLGRILLRASLCFAKGKSYERTILCVNAENDRAKALYVQEGFNQVESLACYKYELI